MRSRDPFSFGFWLAWIFWFAVSFILLAVLWTFLLTALFEKIEGAELTFTWSVAVFGSWFLALIPFMRKKERIWKRLNRDQEAAVDAWLRGMGFFVGLLIASTLVWSFLFRERLGASGGFDGTWLKAVVLTWLILALPFLVLMYRSADRIFKRAVVRQTLPQTPFRTQLVPKNSRLLPARIQAKLQACPPVMEGAHVVDVLLKDGRRIPHVFVLKSSEILGVYDRLDLGFDARDVMDVVPVPRDRLPAYEESKWLRVDGKV